MATVRIFGITFSFTYWWEFLSNYKDIFFLRSYYFRSDTNEPFIIDCGSHIGISVLYFKYLYPRSQVLAFEANPKTYELLKLNVRQNRLTGVSLVEAAVGAKNGTINFYAANANLKHHLGDSTVKNSWYDPKKYDTVRIHAKRLSPFITRPIEVLNLDIEGAEGAVLKEIEHKLHLVRKIFMEYHGSSNPDNNLEDILSVLKKHKFTFSVYHPPTIFSPYRKPLDVRALTDEERRFLIITAKKNG